LAASVEKYSEHPLAEAVREAAYAQRLVLEEPKDFVSIPGLGVQATVGDRNVGVGSARMFNDVGKIANLSDPGDPTTQDGKTLLFVAVDGELVGWLSAADRMRPEVPAAIQEIFELGIREVELLTGDNQGTASDIAGRITEQLSEGCVIRFRANLMPGDKIRIVKGYQGDGHTVIMVGDGVNDAPALAQADVGIAMGAAGSAVAIEAAHVALMNDDWFLVPEVIRISHRTIRVVQMNIGFTAIYNLAGLTLAALGYLPPVLAAAAQSLPDLGILANSSRLLRQGGGEPGRYLRGSS
jgi:Cd2+/Zn2+-exporting ATPase/Cu+-exporting ATPase